LASDVTWSLFAPKKVLELPGPYGQRYEEAEAAGLAERTVKRASCARA
jgi:hypothetical protein